MLQKDTNICCLYCFIGECFSSSQPPVCSSQQTQTFYIYILYVFVGSIIAVQQCAQQPSELGKGSIWCSDWHLEGNCGKLLEADFHLSRSQGREYLADPFFLYLTCILEQYKKQLQIEICVCAASVAANLPTVVHQDPDGRNKTEPSGWWEGEQAVYFLLSDCKWLIS